MKVSYVSDFRFSVMSLSRQKWRKSPDQLGLGEKLLEEKGKVTSQTIKSRGTEGVTSESIFVGDIEGFGRLKGVVGKYMATAITTQKDAITRGSFHGVMTTNDGEAVTMQGFGTGRGEKNKFRGANLVVFSTDSQKLSWMNRIIAFWEVTADAKSLGFIGIAYEWK